MGYLDELRAAHPMDHPFQLPREFHTDLMSPSILSAIKQRSRCDAPSSTTLIHKDEPSHSPHSKQ